MPRSPFRALLLVAVVAAAADARAVELSLKLEPAVALPITQPQSSLFGLGYNVVLKGALGVGHVVALQATGGYLSIGAVGPGQGGVAWTAGGGARLQRPHGPGRFFPWVDGDLLYVRTGPLDRFGFAVAGGVAFPVGPGKRLWISPMLRYFQIVQTERPGYDDRDAKIVLVGISLEIAGALRVDPAQADRDGDGIPDAFDVCPDQPEDKDGFEDADGCPEPDNDKDGIEDKDDLCPNQPEDKDGYQDDDGCPDLDNDGDGVPDVKDRCPNEPEDRDGFQDDDGCPDPDNDGDGIPDRDDTCPNLPGTKESAGCPDRDLDGVADQDDHCPDVPGPRDNQGCPRYKSIAIKGDKIELSQKIFFAHDLTRILPKSYPLLDEVAGALKDNKSLRVRIEGHTDDRGTPEHNQTLATGRAMAVRQYLVQHGVDAQRLEGRGYGSTLPIDTNTTVAGRENNRRVEFVIVRDEPAGEARPDDKKPDDKKHDDKKADDKKRDDKKPDGGSDKR